MIKYCFLLITLLFPYFSFSQKINKLKHNERHGIWIIYQDSTHKVIDNIGKYRKGIPKGTWRYYDELGRLTKKEKHFFRKTYIKFYHSNGNLKKKGKAKTIVDDRLIHYYYYGNWNVCDTMGLLVKKQFYKEGYKISESGVRNNDKTIQNDSLTKTMQEINTAFFKYSDSITITQQKFGIRSEEYERIVSLSNLNALKILEDLDKIIVQYGYPGKTLVGEEYAIAFSIISSSNIKFKEKYHDLIVNAADKKELEWDDVVFFVDKVKVAKKEKQLYGTQYRYDEKLNQIFYYPIEKKEELNQRRKEKGLKEIDPSSLNDTANYN
ncbi:MAG: hypothetical protein K0S44_1964 [Bacteroidetes bacterium]|jgi:hypothetical protein|nr:hypothetical protein [Bacteroidota bacterium]